MYSPFFCDTSPCANPVALASGQSTSSGSTSTRTLAARMPSSITDRAPMRRMFASCIALVCARSFATSSGPMPAGSPVKSAMVGFMAYSSFTLASLMSLPKRS
jgi:hypothetical protein